MMISKIREIAARYKRESAGKVACIIAGSLVSVPKDAVPSSSTRYNGVHFVIIHSCSLSKGITSAYISAERPTHNKWHDEMVAR